LGEGEREERKVGDDVFLELVRMLRQIVAERPEIVLRLQERYRRARSKLKRLEAVMDGT
jgi:hypothetical protein